MRFRPLLIALTPVLLLATGCGTKKLNETKTLTLDGEYGVRSLDIPAQKKATKVTVEFSSSSGDVTVRAFKESDAPGDKGLTENDPSKALVKKRGKADSFPVEVPENTVIRIIVSEHSAAKTDVTIKVVEQ